uniref:ANK_REP_REGION domain-containing protein n=1 Tax=Angiostrongylus cantonensis TaxID=6313 RepID=A0A0K0D6F5_ANGCA
LKRKSCRGIADEVDAESSRTRSPTDSGYRSTPREPSVENFYSHSEFTPNHILHKTTTVIYVNGGETHSGDYSILKVYGANHSAIDNFALCKDIFQENSQCPFNESDINLLLSKKILQKNGSYFDKSFLPRMTDLLLNTLENIAEHIQRLSINNAKATDDDVTTSAKVSYSCIKAANQALALYCTGGSHVLKKSMSQRALLHLSVGKLFYWLMDKLPGKPFSESVPVCITAILEQALEELLLRLCIPGKFRTAWKYAELLALEL